ncbi:MAG: M23 family metallopeptidase, partial [Bacteroidales bacterium]|nr:M23 family metallopeptidase [Bacteroidales bacterium]
KNDIKERYSGHYLLRILKESTFEEIKVFRVTRKRMIFLGISSMIVLIVLTGTLIFFTPIRALIPGYPSDEFRKQLIANNMLADSLQTELQLRDQYITNIKQIMTGDIHTDYTDTIELNQKYTSLDFPTSKEDSLLRMSVEEIEEQPPIEMPEEEGVYNLGGNLNLTHFFPPVKGYVTNSMNLSLNHFGTDIVTEPDMIVKSILDGVVILSTWSLEFGYTIYIQHENNLVSVYKHNAVLFKQSGVRVAAGDAIAVVGNTGELTSGPHLHFELWFNGTPLNPEEYINF